MATKLPAWVWLAVGLAITITSGYVGMTLFFWLGWLFIIVGIAKFIIEFATREKQTPREKKEIKQATHQYYRCSCGNTTRAIDHFCSHCGRQLR